MSTTDLRVLIFGAHPDDPDFSAGGVAALYSRQGHTVKMVSLTNGDAGHHEMGMRHNWYRMPPIWSLYPTSFLIYLISRPCL